MMNFSKRRETLKERLKESGYSVAIITDPSYIFYLTGFHGALGIEWGRPGIFVLPVEGEPTIITPSMEEEMARKQTKLDNVLIWADGLDGEWGKHLEPILNKYKGTKIGIDHYLMPRVVWDFISDRVGAEALDDVAPVINKMRMIKDADEIQIARHTGEVAVTMMKAAMEAAAPGVKEYEVSLAARAAGTRKAAEIMEKHYKEYEPFNYPSISFQQIMASGEQTRMCHHKNSTTELEYGEPLFICFCGTTRFMNFSLGFDRTLFVGEINEEVSKLLEIAEKAQKAALAKVKPGAYAEDVFYAYQEVITGAGYPIPFRAGRSQGVAVNETPQLAKGDKTILQPGMVLAVDGGANGDKYRVQVGDSILVTEDGYEMLTDFTNIHRELIVGKK
jgi:Xaa-Pro aminopeptidase